jgi:hypothetical protein
MGHADDDVHGLYGTGIPLKLLDVELQKIGYELGLVHLISGGVPEGSAGDAQEEIEA